MKDRVIALAGLLQAVRLVQEMANNGQAESRPLAACNGRRLALAADTPEAVFGGVVAAQGADAVRTEEFAFVEHALQEQAHAILPDQGEETALALTGYLPV